MAGAKPQIWRMFAGKDHYQWRNWIRLGVMAIGRGQDIRIESLRDCTYADIEDIFVDEYGDTRGARFEAEQFWRFAVEAREGDLVCVYDMGSVLGIGIIVGDFQYVDDSLSDDNSVFACRRDVEWLRITRQGLSEFHKSALWQLNQGSIVRIDDERVKSAVRLWAHSGADESIRDISKESDSEIGEDEYEKRTGRVTRTAVKRDSKKAGKFRRANNMSCQICGSSIRLPDGRRFVEVHHIRPLGTPHNGADRMSNMICLCPNHHVEMDLGAFYIDSKSRTVVHFDRRSSAHGKEVDSVRKEWPDAQSLKYHKTVICDEWAK